MAAIDREERMSGPAPVQYHYAVWAEFQDDKIEWHIDIEGELLYSIIDGSVYDPNVARLVGDGWRTLSDSEEGLDNRLVAELERLLGVKY